MFWGAEMSDWKQDLDRKAQAAEDCPDRNSEFGLAMRAACERIYSERQVQYASDDLIGHDGTPVDYFLARRIGYSDHEKCVRLDEHLEALRKAKYEWCIGRTAIFLLLVAVAYIAGNLVRG
jgi:hypothetical protein